MIKLLLGDCLERMRELDDNSIDLILTDPPYGTTACKWDSVIPLDKMWTQLNKVTKKAGIFAIFGMEPFSSFLRISNIENYKYDWIWNKITATGHFSAKTQPMRQHELISIFGREKSQYNPQMTIRPQPRITRGYNISEIYGGGKSKMLKKEYVNWYPKSIQKFKVERGLHPTQKPVPLMGYLIKTYTKKGNTVLDFTMGSGTTGVAAKVLGRNFIGIELDEEYFRIAQERIEGTKLK